MSRPALMSEPARSARRDGVVLGLAFALSLLHAAYFDHTCDDAFISFRYAENFASGQGLVFNPGEYVMGYSNLLWVLLLAALETLGISAPLGARVLGVMLAWGTLTVVYFYLRRTHGLPEAVWGVAFLTANATFAVWMFGGLEGHLFAFLLVSAVVLTLTQPTSHRGYAGIGLLLGLASLTRPEGIFYAVPVTGYLLLRDPTRSTIRRAATAMGIAAACYAGAAAWALAYYGDPLPNPIQAKLHPLSAELLERGAAIALGFIQGYLWVPVLIVLLWAAVRRPSLQAPDWLPLGIVAAFLVFFLGVGGDALVYYRMWLWVLPMLTLLGAAALADLRHSGLHSGVSIGLGVLLIALTAQNSFRGPELRRLRDDEAFVQDVVLLSRSLEKLPPNTLIAANNIGALGYVSRKPILDMLGLINRHIARAPEKRIGIPGHESHDGAHVLDQRPHLIIFGMPGLTEHPRSIQQLVAIGYPSDRDLEGDRRFRRDYELQQIRVADGRVASVFQRRDLRRRP